ncbi:MAG: 16S rRNA (cytosine(1402)-N(4))-methyltransferase RsmH [Candidatus Izemoplasmatales bacterium]|jgi:16S rRNA (cytosine1402-N4)-methyltransferase|nr:16S rRNA (cytosine(1402)-N(4))-methyltransferase RsmH [Candidatus Izemoplasmatales bacterium]
MEKHIPVLLNETIELLNINKNCIYVDMTLGGGGHSEAILSLLDKGKLYGFDQDIFAIEKASERLKTYKNFKAINANFYNAKEKLAEIGVDEVDGIIFDLGVSSFQFDMPERGFSYRFDAPLDMRMDQQANLAAYHVVNNYSFEDLIKIFFEYGEEKFARLIAKNIIKHRTLKPIKTTFELVDIIKEAMPNKELNKKGHPAKKVFQAIRIEVNQELEILEESLIKAIDLLKPNGRLAVITFHSLEDRIVKQLFKRLSTIEIPKGLAIIPDETPLINLVTRKVVTAQETELSDNNRAHSAKLRVIEKNDK